MVTVSVTMSDVMIMTSITNVMIMTAITNVMVMTVSVVVFVFILLIFVLVAMIMDTWIVVVVMDWIRLIVASIFSRSKVIIFDSAAIFEIWRSMRVIANSVGHWVPSVCKTVQLVSICNPFALIAVEESWLVNKLISIMTICLNACLWSSNETVVMSTATFVFIAFTSSSAVGAIIISLSSEAAHSIHPVALLTTNFHTDLPFSVGVPT